MQLLALSFASTGKEYKLFGNLYRSLRNRDVTFPNEDSVDIFTPNLSEEPVHNVPQNAHVRRDCDDCVILGYTSPNAKLENDLHIVQKHMVKMQSIILKRNRRNCIPENKQRVTGWWERSDE